MRASHANQRSSCVTWEAPRRDLDTLCECDRRLALPRVVLSSAHELDNRGRFAAYGVSVRVRECYRWPLTHSCRGSACGGRMAALALLLNDLTGDPERFYPPKTALRTDAPRHASGLSLLPVSAKDCGSNVADDG
jgi:hypothetical protein